MGVSSVWTGVNAGSSPVYPTDEIKRECVVNRLHTSPGRKRSGSNPTFSTGLVRFLACNNKKSNGAIHHWSGLPHCL